MSGIFQLHLNEIDATERTPSVDGMYRIQVDGPNAVSESFPSHFPPSPDHRKSSQQDDVKAGSVKVADCCQHQIVDTPILLNDSDAFRHRTCAEPNWRQSLPPPTLYQRPTIKTVKSFQPVAPKDPMLDMVYRLHRQHIFRLLVENNEIGPGCVVCEQPLRDSFIAN